MHVVDKSAQQAIIERLEPGGNLIVVHWTLFAKDYPLSGDEVHDSCVALRDYVTCTASATKNTGLMCGSGAKQGTQLAARAR